jgi:acyl-coenzyme A synthetase/AMP-(fatty) acid ligase
MAKFDVVKFNDFPALRRLLWCGEVFPTPALIYWMTRLSKVSFTNLYGPTEATIASSYYDVKACPEHDTQPIPIGTACEGEALLVLDGDRKPMPPGEVGDLYIGGAGLSPGYWRDPTKTDSAFFPYDGGRIYKTGDLARIADDGLVYFVGRADTQIKSRGYRIELGEIEAALNVFQELKECAVVSIPSDGFETNLICCAFVAQDNANVTASDIRHKLSALLPAYMLPSRWIRLAQLPKNANGKADRRNLQDQFAAEAAKSVPKTAETDADSQHANCQAAEPREIAEGASEALRHGLSSCQRVT